MINARILRVIDSAVLVFGTVHLIQGGGTTGKTLMAVLEPGSGLGRVGAPSAIIYRRGAQ